MSLRAAGGPAKASDSTGSIRLCHPRWIEGLLDPEKIATAEYFGNTSHKEGDMASFVQGDEFKGFCAAQRHEIAVALSAEAKLDDPRGGAKDAATIASAQALIKETGRLHQLSPFSRRRRVWAVPPI